MAHGSEPSSQTAEICHCTGRRYQKCRENCKNRPQRWLISRRLSPGFQLIAWLMWHKLGNWSNTKETSMSKYLEHNKHPTGDTSAKQSIHQFRVHRKLHLQSFCASQCEESKRSKLVQNHRQPICNTKAEIMRFMSPSFVSILCVAMHVAPGLHLSVRRSTILARLVTQANSKHVFLSFSHQFCKKKMSTS